MTSPLKERAKNLILGALVADAAAMGLHWIYDQDHIAKIAPDTPEFRDPVAQNYAGVSAFFAHGTLRAGQQSQYGAQVLVMLRALVAQDGRYDPVEYAGQFRAHFGYGGGWVGYIDHATRETLNNFLRSNDAALARARAVPFEGDPKVTLAMVTKATALIPRHTGGALRQAFEDAARLTHDDDALVAYGLQVLEALSVMDPVYGAPDVQLPAVSKLPGLVAAYASGPADDEFVQAVTSAVRTTSDHPTALAHGRVCARMMRQVVLGDGFDAAVAAGRAVATPAVDALLGDALSRQAQGTLEVTRHFGMACDLDYGVPNVVHNITTAPDFTQAVRRNIYAGGDSCGRAILVGALCGAVHGVGGDRGIPEAWIEKLSCKSDLDAMMTQLFG